MINEDLLLDSLYKFYDNPYNGSRLVSILKGETNTSLRSVDWFITNYSKKNNIYYNIYRTNNNIPSFSEKDNHLVCNLNVFQSYKSQLRAYSKKRFDPFCRRNRIKYNCQGEILDTTIGQLNFLKWAINNLIMDYIKVHKDNIEFDMNTCLKEMKLSGSLMKKEGKRKKRQELSLSATRGLSRNNVSVRLDFD
tara:strand:+ start:176 stop:754 length:579 start_codon:yes stop_codon:yes gene_type:complete